MDPQLEVKIINYKKEVELIFTGTDENSLYKDMMVKKYESLFPEYKITPIIK